MRSRGEGWNFFLKILSIRGLEVKEWRGQLWGRKTAQAAVVSEAWSGLRLMAGDQPRGY